jgi:isopentenyl-diphosphate delta-isomerase
MQEAMQPEGDIFKRSPLEIIEEVLDRLQYPIIVKEVGQGFGPASLRALMQLPLAAIEFAAAGGTNFAKLELLRSEPEKLAVFEKMAAVGHSAEEMLHWSNTLHAELGLQCKVQHLILSGGVSDFLDGYYLIRKSAIPAVYGQASGFLKYAQDDYETLRKHILSQVRGLELAFSFLQVK